MPSLSQRSGRTSCDTPRRCWTFLKFLAAGGPAFLLAVPGNYLLVDRFHLQKPLAYLAVLLVQVNCNFFMCQIIVFRKEMCRFSFNNYGRFIFGIMGFRLLDWCLYVFLVNKAGLQYLLVQVLNLAIFSLAKFVFAERLFDRRATTDTSAAYHGH